MGALPDCLAPIGATNSATANATATRRARRASLIGAPVLLQRFRRRRVTGAEHPPIRQRDADECGIRTAILQRVGDDGHLVSGLERRSCPAGARHHVGASAFESPLRLL